jgi:hypothetical protein
MSYAGNCSFGQLTLQHLPTIRIILDIKVEELRLQRSRTRLILRIMVWLFKSARFITVAAADIPQDTYVQVLQALLYVCEGRIWGMGSALSDIRGGKLTLMSFAGNPAL